MARTIRLVVRKSLLAPAHADRPKVELSRKAMDESGLAEGDLVELRGMRTCGGIAYHSYMVDDDKVRLSSFLLRNAGVGEGEHVSLRKANPSEAQVVVIACSLDRREDLMRYLRQKLMGMPVSEGDIIPVRSILGSLLYLQILSVEPPKLAKIGQRTIITLKSVSKEQTREVPQRTGFGQGSSLVELGLNLGIRRLAQHSQTSSQGQEPLQIELRETMPAVRYEDIGGLSEQIDQVREVIELPLTHPEVFKHFGIKPPRGVLFAGPPGTGKTLLAKAVASSVKADVFTVRGPEVVAKWYGESEAKLREVFSNAKRAAPSIIIFDEIDSLASKRDGGEGRDVERRIVSTLLTLMDGLSDRGEVVVIGTTNNPDLLDPALRRPGRLDREIAFPVPNAQGRLEILKVHTRNVPLAKDVDLVKIAERTHGMTGADIEAICREAALNSIRRHQSELKKRPETLPTMVVEAEDFEAVLEKVRPSSLRGWLTFTTKTKSEDIGGLHEVKRRLTEALILPLKDPRKYRKMGVDPVKGVILYGSPGNGKTMLCRWIASETDANTILVNSTEMISKLVGESERNVRNAFEMARTSAPCVLVFDEIDSICPRRGGELDSGVSNRVVSTFLMEMDGLKPLSDVVVMGTTNRIDIMDPALLRPGRFDLKVEVPPPDEEARYGIFKTSTRKIPLGEDVDLGTLAKLTDGFSGAEIAGLCREAALTALRRGSSTVLAPDFEGALKTWETGAKGGKDR